MYPETPRHLALQGLQFYERGSGWKYLRLMGLRYCVCDSQWKPKEFIRAWQDVKRNRVDQWES